MASEGSRDRPIPRTRDGGRGVGATTQQEAPRLSWVIDPSERWPRGHEQKPDYAGLLTYGGARYTQDRSELRGADVAVVGLRQTTSYRIGPAHVSGPRAIRAASCPPGPHLEVRVDAFDELEIVDFGDAR
jgi:hypothetical protein